MKDDPDIIKELREKEKIGKLRSSTEDEDVHDIHDIEKSFEETSDGTINVFEEPLQKIEEDIAEKYQLLFENFTVAITLADEKERIISWNKYAEELLNMNEKDLFMKPVKTLYPPEEWEKIREENIRQKGMRYKLETKVLRKDKEPIDVELSLCVLKGRNKEICGSIGILRDITKLKTTEKKLMESEEKYKNLFQTAIDPIVVLDKEGKFIDVNEQVTKILGYDKDDLIGKKFDEAEILTDESVTITIDNFLKRMNGENVPTYEVKAVSRNGEIIPAEINANALYENGEIVGDLIIIRDLRDRYKREEVEKELAQSENRFRNIFDATSDFLIYLEKDMILDLNDTTTILTGLTKENTIGKNFSELKEIFSEEDMKKHLEAIKHTSDGVKLRDYESDLKAINGNIYRFLFSVDCIRDDQEIRGILLRGKDITQRQRAWDELVKLEEKYRVLAETSADGVITVDALGRLTYVNPSFEKMCDRRKSQILATLFRDYLSEDSVYFFQQIFIDARKKDEKIENIELELVHAEGDIIPIEVNIAPYKKDDEFAGMVCTIRDITERRRVEDELKKSERLKTEFMNIAAHELKSPVTPIKGYLDLIISDKETSKKVKDWAKVSLRNAERLLKLVNDILDVSRLDTDTMRFEMERLDTLEILDEIVEDMRPVIEAKDLKFITKIPRDLPNIMGDRHRLPQVLKNLFVNAIKFTDNGSISIEAEKKDERVIITIIDTGIGISKDEVKKVFTKFYQAYTGDDRKNEGTGLGLFICREIIQKHKGEIWAESELGKGSKFIIKLPYLHKMVVDLNENEE
jgi:PAS domain S-box-containing protein